MSSRAFVVADPAQVVPFVWSDVPLPQPQATCVRPQEPPAALPAAAQASQAAAAPQQLALIEREAFAKGYEQGERAGAEAAGQRGEAMLRRLAETLGELTTLRATMIRQTESQLVELALAVARRVVHREIALDRNLLVAIARVALDRLGESAQVTVRLHPEEFAATAAAQVDASAASGITFVADARVGRGGCRVESDMGMVDAGVDAQIQEIARALLGEDHRGPASDGRGWGTVGLQ
jgi:flagellar assembly protein FliH